MSRRRALATAPAVATALLAGCRSLGFGERVEGGHLFVENQLDEPVEIALSLIRQSDGERLVHALYRVPGSSVLQFQEVLSAGTEYTVRAVQPELDRGPGTNLDVVAETCEEDDPSGKIDIAILAGESGPEIIVYDCENAYVRTGDMTYVDPGEYQVRELTGTVSSLTPAG